jgi:Bacterial toxin 33
MVRKVPPDENAGMSFFSSGYFRGSLPPQGMAHRIGDHLIMGCSTGRADRVDSDNQPQVLSVHDADPCEQQLSPYEIGKLKRAGIDVERLKWEFGSRPPSRFDLYKCRNGDIVIKRKGDSRGPGEFTGLNIDQF